MLYSLKNNRLEFKKAEGDFWKYTFIYKRFLCWGKG